MPKLINADNLRKNVLYLPNCYNGFSDSFDKELIVDLIDEQPPVDAIPVVRCKDCKWRNGLRCYHKRSGMDDLVGENDYCSWGERKEDADK